MNKVIKEQIKAYQNNFKKHSDSTLGVFWNNKATQYERFNQLLYPLLEHKSSNFSICDVGCGVCDLYYFLNEKKITHIYTGIEIVPEMIEKAKERDNNLRILNENILEENFQEKFDFLVLSGVFNLPGNVTRDEWEQFVFAMIKKMFALSEAGISFNALTTYSTFKANELFYIDPMKMFDFIQKNLSRFCVVSTNSPLYEVTYSVFKEKQVHRKYPEKEFEKYFKNI